MLEGFSEVFKILANKVNGKAPVIMASMFLVYSVAVAEVITHGLLAIGVITGLSIFYTGLQFVLEMKKIKKENNG